MNKKKIIYEILDVILSLILTLIIIALLYPFTYFGVNSLVEFFTNYRSQAQTVNVVLAITLALELIVFEIIIKAKLTKLAWSINKTNLTSFERIVNKDKDNIIEEDTKAQ